MYKWIMAALLVGASILGISVLIIQSNGNGEKEAAPPPLEENITVNAEAAEALYKNSCISCHGGNLEGGIGSNLQKVGENLTAQQIQQVLLNGRGMMPSFKEKLSDDEITNMVGWLAEHK